MKFNYRFIVYFIFVLALIYVFAPYLWVFTAAFSRAANFEIKIPRPPTLKNFIEIFKGKPRIWILNSVLISLSVVGLTIAVTSLGGYALSRSSFKGKAILMYMIILFQVLPFTLLAVPIYSILLLFNLLDTYLGLILVQAAIQVPISLWIMKGTIDSIPLELEEAAEIDGATGILILLKIILPLIRPGIAAVGVLAFVASWGNFLMPLILISSESKMPISVGLYSAFGIWGDIDYAQLAAMSLVYMLPVIIFYLCLRSYFSRGMGGVATGR